MSAANVNRAAILRDICIVTTANIAAYPNLTDAFALTHNVLSKLLGREMYLVTWPNGIAAMVDSEPGTAEWDALIVKTYLACLLNYVGPVGA